jgi:hypothetical protein
LKIEVVPAHVGVNSQGRGLLLHIRAEGDDPRWDRNRRGRAARIPEMNQLRLRLTGNHNFFLLPDSGNESVEIETNRKSHIFSLISENKSITYVV